MAGIGLSHIGHGIDIHAGRMVGEVAAHHHLIGLTGSQVHIDVIHISHQFAIVRIGGMLEHPELQGVYLLLVLGSRLIAFIATRGDGVAWCIDVYGQVAVLPVIAVAKAEALPAVAGRHQHRCHEQTHYPYYALLHRFFLLTIPVLPAPQWTRSIRSPPSRLPRDVPRAGRAPRCMPSPGCSRSVLPA